MGMDGVEMAMAVEEAFGIDIPDADAAAMRTVRDLSVWVGARVGARALGPCRTRRAFHRLRAALREELGVPRAAIRLETRIDDLLATPRERERWQTLRERLGEGWYPKRHGWLGDTLHGMVGAHREPRYRANRPAQTVGDTARDVAAWDADVRPAPGQAWSREGVALTMRRIIHHEFAEFGFSEDASFVKDLGFD
jgi:hypothetical protein